MNKSTIRVINKVVNGENVTRDVLRHVAKEQNIKQGKTKAELVSNICEFAKANSSALNVTVSRGPGRPKASECPIVGYKVKVGLRYPTEEGLSMTTSMKEGKIFDTPEAALAAIDKLVEAGEVKPWNGTVRAKVLPRYGKSE